MDLRERTVWQQRSELLHILACLWRMAGLGSRDMIPRSLHRMVARLLRPAEAAARRLIVVLARGIVVALPPSVARQQPDRVQNPAQWQAFALTDPMPRLPVPDDAPRPVPDIVAARGAEIRAERLCRRLEALCQALDDLPAQAERLARWQARRRRARQRGAFCMLRPLRPGPPLDLRGRAARRLGSHPLYDLLRAARQNAWWALNTPRDTS